MALDENRKGIPIAKIVFSATPNAKATHADYNGPLVQGLIEKWQVELGTPQGEAFEFCVGMTDNDAKIWKLLVNIWPAIHLLLCRYHLWDCWKQGLNRYLKVIPKGESHTEICHHLGKFLMAQLDTSDYTKAVDLYNSELAYLKQLGKQSGIAKKQSKGGLGFLAYFHSHLKVKELWQAWSMAGVNCAAEILRTDPELIPKTNNFLENYNGRIKGKFFQPYQHGGRLPHLDVWVLLITVVMPHFFQELED